MLKPGELEWAGSGGRSPQGPSSNHPLCEWYMIQVKPIMSDNVYCVLRRYEDEVSECESTGLAVVAASAHAVFSLW
jgi:hypothetical protein